MNSLKVVTPVETRYESIPTGVQGIRNYLKSRQWRDWIPAFAGMTGYAVLYALWAMRLY